MEEKEKYETTQDDIPKGEKVPLSKLVIEFAGPGSAQILKMYGEGIVTPEQVGAAGLWLISCAFRDWSIPMLQGVVMDTIKAFQEQAAKPKIEAATPGFYVPPGMLGKKPS